MDIHDDPKTGFPGKLCQDSVAETFASAVVAEDKTFFGAEARRSTRPEGWPEVCLRLKDAGNWMKYKFYDGDFILFQYVFRILQNLSLSVLKKSDV